MNAKCLPFVVLAFLLLQGCPRDEPQDNNQVLPPDKCEINEGPDRDDDGIIDECDNCPDTPNPDQIDTDHDGVGDECDPDWDGDGVSNEEDNCPYVFNPEQTDSDEDGVGDVCDETPFGGVDSDGDGVPDIFDPCPQTETDDEDRDGDGVPDACDNCPDTPNAGQIDLNESGVGDACEADTFTIVEMTIDELHTALEAGDVSCREVVESHIERIWAYDASLSRGAMINAVTEINAAALARASDLDDQGTETLLPLHCVPFVVKPNYRNVDLGANGGTFALEDAVGKTDAFTVDALRDAGAVFIGTTTMDEMASGVQGISARGGRAGNPYAPSRLAGGSSSGSAAAVNASFAAIGMGTDNCASLTMPAAYNGLATLRSTQGLISTRGIIPNGPQDAVAGPMVRSVADLARVMNVLVAPDPGVRFHDEEQAAARPNYRDHLREDGLDGKRIGVLRELSEDTSDGYKRPFDGGSARVGVQFEFVLERLRDSGATVVDNVRLPSFDHRRTGGGLYQEFEAWLESTGGPETILQYCRGGGWSPWIYEDEEACLDRFESQRNRASAIDAGFERYNRNREYIETVMDRLELDALVLPTDAVGYAPTSYKLPNCLVYSTSRLPVLSFSATHDTEAALPIGMMVMGRSFDEATLFEIAYAYEARYNARVAPKLGEPHPDLPAVDIATFNLAKRDAALEGFESVLLEGNKLALNAQKFAQIAEAIWADSNYTWWLP